MRWLHEIYSNSIAILTFAEPSQKLGVASEVDVDLREGKPIELLLASTNCPCEATRTARAERTALSSTRFPTLANLSMIAKG